MDLTPISGLVIAFALFMYVLLDGFDLGVGILFLVDTRKEDRDVMMTSLIPFWDGNETWLVLGGAGLFAAFPLAYATLMPALYIPLMAMLFALVFRGVAFEYRFKSERTQQFWDYLFSFGAGLAAIAQGMALGTVISGIPVADRQFAGGSFDWLTPFNVMCGVGLVFGYALLGATWLVMKTEGDVQRRAYRIAGKLVPAIAMFVMLVSLWTPYAHPSVAERWFSRPNVIYLSPVPIATAVTLLLLWRKLQLRKEVAPFFLTITVFVLSAIGLAVSLFPFVVPYSVTIWDAAPQRKAQSFLLIGITLMLPIVLGYTALNYFIFRGKVGKGGVYH